ncbi:MAG: M18 family aminopeptidase [Bacteroidales bacterium]|nr:M18 family aminopeptidase [Bacteroidales bacterium]
MDLQVANNLLDFIHESPSPFHAIEHVKETLVEKGFEELCLKKEWKLRAGGKYFTTRNGSALVAFTLSAEPEKDLATRGFRIVAAHSDAPTFRVKPNSQLVREGMVSLNVESYGGAILHTWMDRPLSLAGRAIVMDPETKKLTKKLVDFGFPVGVIPSVAIHMNRGVNEQMSLNKQIDMPFLFSTLYGREAQDGVMSMTELLAAMLEVSVGNIVDYDLYAYVTDRGDIVGCDKSMILAPKLDDLSMVFCATEAFCGSIDIVNHARNNILCIFDNEEVGSQTKQGAQSPFLRNVIERITEQMGLTRQQAQMATYNSFMVSADMAHAVHPNHPEYCDPTNRPRLNGGPVIKINANQKYMTDADSSAQFKVLCQIADVPFQMFVNRSDIAGGSTLGNLVTSQLDIHGVDVGNPMLGMHSAVETGGVLDIDYMIDVLERHYVHLDVC